MPHHQQTDVLARVLDILERLVELLLVDEGRFRDLGRIAQSPPFALGIGWRKKSSADGLVKGTKAIRVTGAR